LLTKPADISSDIVPHIESVKGKDDYYYSKNFIMKLSHTLRSKLPMNETRTFIEELANDGLIQYEFNEKKEGE
jgi:hypothetical protein